jgi:hypothetical protein
MVRVLDNPRAVSSHPPAAKVLTAVLDKLSCTSAQNRRGRLALVRKLTVRQRLIAITTPDVNNDAGMNFLDVRNVV